MKLGEWPCPQCRKPASILAERCPACTAIWTPEERAARLREFWISLGVVMSVLASLALWIYLGSD